ncbi:Oidioi.mRNA.OKI2018_I69.PAR.g11340.t1.cds [Oikopleura dioica]|uniref:Oidioi.mRNA.OKI2018_I69.PAR.g11340.t1.cds n=1 Tax=Oikopleura dioica TaxID=34765 RepID=A0ABN7S1Y4_OIKDI|nr:Oidioi.mRNA.OKI2018_I69.PAR.g11340.t1.cds [Oikopleura dioica]
MYFTMRQFYLSSMLDLPMPDYCTTRYTRNDGRRGLRIQTNDVLRGLDAFIVDSRDKKRRDYRFIQVREGSFKPFELEQDFPGFEGVFDNYDYEGGKQITLKNTSHYQFDRDIADQEEFLEYSLTIKANVWQHYTPHQIENSDYEYDYFIEMDPGELGYRAFLLNAQFQGSFDAYGWWETTSEVQFADIDHDPFEDCEGINCYGTLV